MKVEEYLIDKGVHIVRDDGTELACYCPFHHNTDTPAFYINKSTGLWICFNPACEKRGSLRDLREFFGDSNQKWTREYSFEEIEANLNFVQKKDDDGWAETHSRIVLSPSDLHAKASYLLDRGFTAETLLRFEVGYSEQKKRLVIPVRNEMFKVIGFIGRSDNPNTEPKYLYSKGFPRKSALFNINNAKTYNSVIVVEGSLDAMKVHQAGFPNVVSTLGAAVTEDHISMIRRFFESVVIFSDNDHAGYIMRDKIISGVSDMGVRIVSFEDSDKKDAGDMNEEEIARHISSARDWLSVAMGDL
jgi:DNA primase